MVACRKDRVRKYTKEKDEHQLPPVNNVPLRRLARSSALYLIDFSFMSLYSFMSSWLLEIDNMVR